jgi:hypothetical protein
MTDIDGDRAKIWLGFAGQTTAQLYLSNGSQSTFDTNAM